MLRPGLMTTDEAARALSLDPATLEKWARLGIVRPKASTDDGQIPTTATAGAGLPTDGNHPQMRNRNDCTSANQLKNPYMGAHPDYAPMWDRPGGVTSPPLLTCDDA